MAKRKTSDKDSDSLEDFMDEVGLTPEVLERLGEHHEATKIVAEIVNRLGIKDSALKRARVELPSFSKITWGQVASHFGLLRTFGWLSFDSIPGVTLCYLPPSFHKELLMRSWSAMNVYAEPTQRKLEAPRVRLLDIARLVSSFQYPGLTLSQYLVPLFALFAGRIEDFPEHPMPETELSSGGSVEHEYFIVGKILFLVIELKANFDDLESNVAQLFSELYAASKLNGDAGFESLTVYGLLTDLGTFHFYSFNPISKTFYQDPRMVVHSLLREEFLYGMMAVVDRIFTLVLQGYIDTLKATCAKIEEQLSSKQSSSGSPTTKAFLEDWRKAHQHGLAAQNKLKQFSGNETELEESAAKGLESLKNSVACVGRLTYTSSKHDIPSKADLETIAQKAVDKWRVDLCAEHAVTQPSSDA
ncbi:hypothetical protein GGX14DRAFT_621645 [Mycena pura]|uniref:Uncharacterized protein n=1 Tax=Mycena pura TaxID=153505 RepID=A0AAD6VNK3_9AGAR|nr:hypothetical protein GGX14DRAFT_621645 [Mycena pura]